MTSLSITPACAAQRIVNQQRLPLPGSLFTPISQPMALANCAQIERPKPAPPCFLVTGPSACVNGWNNRSRYSDDMPIPWSVTSIRRTTSSSGLSDS
jgi:hypothetical protein